MSCPTGMLISLEDEDQSSSKSDSLSPLTSPKSATASSGFVQVSSQTSTNNKKNPAKLCGYLTRVSSTGIVKLSKTRWFSYTPDTCELVFMRNPDQETESIGNMGRIPLRRASFNFTASSLQDNLFSITSDGTTHNLQASDRKTLMWWIQELQSRRRAFNLQQAEDYPQKPDWQGSIQGASVFWVSNTQEIKPGLIGVKQSSVKSDVGIAPAPLRVFQPDEEPPDTVGDQAATLHNRSSSFTPGNSIAVLGNKLPMPSLGNINTAFTNAGEAAKKTLRNQAIKLKSSGGKTDDSMIGGAVSKSLAASSALNQGILHPSPKRSSTNASDMGYGSFIKGLKGEILQLHDEMTMMKMKLQTKEESIQVLKLELDKYEQLSKGTLPPHSVFSNEERKMRSELISLKLTNERLQQEGDESQTRENALKEQNSMLQEMLSVKDAVVMQLSNQLHDLERNHTQLTDDHTKLKEEKNEEFVILSPATASVGEDIDLLKDQAEGYMMQNKLLNNEILELANLRQMDGERLESMHDKIKLKEAQYCQLNSKYLVLLAEMNKPRSESVGLAVAGEKVAPSDKDKKDMVKILIQEALAETSVVTTRKESKYDVFGFTCLPEDDAESSLLASASQMEKRASDIIFSLNEYNASIDAKWQNYFAASRGDLLRNEDTKLLIRYGVPHDLRPKVWTWMVKHRTLQLRNRLDPDGSYYKKLCQRSVAPLAAKQIELDLLRTLPNNKHFVSLSSDGIEQLRRVLRAFSLHNPSIGYCQGLNRVVAVALLYLCEEEAFWCVVAVTELIMPPDYYSDTLTASQADQRVFRELMAEKLPRLHKHLETLQVDCSLITFNWLLCIYCDNVPPATMLHIWDVFLNEGSKVLFRYGLAFFYTVEEELLQLTDYMSVFAFLRVMSHRMHDVRSLTQIAFQTMNPFPMRRINRLRLFHIEKVEAELRDLDVIRKGFVSQRRAPPTDRDSDDD